MRRFNLYKIAFILLFSAPLLLGLGACTKTESNRLTMGWTEGPQAGLNPFLARNEGDYLFLGLIYEPLCMPMMDGSVRPWIAKSWEYEAGENAWVFHLDERAKWSDGEPLTAEDVKFTFETAYQYNFALGSITKEFVDSIQAMDAQTVRFNMSQPFAAFLPLAGGTLIMPEHVWSKVGEIDLYRNENPVGSGPFLFKQFRPRVFLQVVKNDDYWQGAPKVEEVMIRIFLNAEAEVVAFMKGELDVLPDLSGSEALIPPLEGDENIKVLVDSWPHILYLAVNHRIHPLGNKEFRKAIDIALDKERIIRTAMAGYAELPLMGYIPPLVTKWAHPDVRWRGLDVSEEERVGEANAMLDRLGFTRADDGTRRDQDGKPLEFNINSLTYPSYIRIAELVKKSLADLGIKLTVRVSDPESLYGGLIFSGQRSLDWDMLVHGSAMSPDPDHFAREFAPDPPNPWDNAVAFGWENEALQTLLQASRREMDEKKRWSMIQEAQEIFADELPVITLGHRMHPAAYRTDRFKGWNPEQMNYGGMMHPLGSIVNLISLEPL